MRCINKSNLYICEIKQHTKDMRTMQKKTLCIVLLILCIGVCSTSFFEPVLSCGSALEQRLSFSIVFVGGKDEKERVFRYEDSFSKATNHIVEWDFFRRKINASAQEKIDLLRQLNERGFSPERALKYVLPKMFDTIDKVEKKLYKKPLDSKVIFRPDEVEMFDVKPHANGRQLDRDMLIRDIFAALLKGKFNCKARVQVIYPEIEKSYNSQATCFRAGFSTDFVNSSENRKHNIKLSLSKLNGVILKPKQVFSFNKIVGSRTEKQGYKESKIIFNGRFVEGVGGGVCQVSTTLYNAAIRADMCILSVKNHSLPVNYVQPSMDAMVNSGTTDLKFENNSTHPVYIKAHALNNQAIIEFYGLPMRYQIVPESEIVDSIPPPAECDVLIDTEYKYLPLDAISGQTYQVSQSKGGLSSKAYLCYFDSLGNLVAKRHIRTDKYKAQKGLIAIAP